MAGINATKCVCGGGQGARHADWCLYPSKTVAGLDLGVKGTPKVSAAGRDWDEWLEGLHRKAALEWVKEGKPL